MCMDQSDALTNQNDPKKAEAAKDSGQSNLTIYWLPWCVIHLPSSFSSVHNTSASNQLMTTVDVADLPPVCQIPYPTPFAIAVRQYHHLQVLCISVDLGSACRLLT